MRKATLLTTLALLTIMNTGCEPEGTETGPVVCTVVVDAPAKMEDEEKIVAGVRFRCESPGAEVLTLKVKLERRKGEQWHTVASKTFTLKGQETYAQPLEVPVPAGRGRLFDWDIPQRRRLVADLQEEHQGRQPGERHDARPM